MFCASFCGIQRGRRAPRSEELGAPLSEELGAPRSEEFRAKLKIGSLFLRLPCDEKPKLVKRIRSSESRRESEFNFIKGLERREDIPDGQDRVLFTAKIMATRCGKTLYLCAKRLTADAGYSVEVESDPQDKCACQWILRAISGSEYVLESERFQGYCLVNCNGALTLDKMDFQKRNNRVFVFYDKAAFNEIAANNTSQSMKCIEKGATFSCENESPQTFDLLDSAEPAPNNFRTPSSNDLTEVDVSRESAPSVSSKPACSTNCTLDIQITSVRQMNAPGSLNDVDISVHKDSSRTHKVRRFVANMFTRLAPKKTRFSSSTT